MNYFFLHFNDQFKNIKGDLKCKLLGNLGVLDGILKERYNTPINACKLLRKAINYNIPKISSQIPYGRNICWCLFSYTKKVLLF